MTQAEEDEEEQWLVRLPVVKERTKGETDVPVARDEIESMPAQSRFFDVPYQRPSPIRAEEKVGTEIPRGAKEVLRICTPKGAVCV